MSEYQYYEFQAIDRLLTDAEFESIKKLSSRGNVSRSQAIFVYNYGDFRYEPIEILSKHFDMMLYMANWGTRRLCFRLPKKLVNLEEITFYCVPDVITTSIVNDHVVIDIHFNSDGGYGWIEGDGILSELLALRNDILQGDYRTLYIAWLGSLTQDNADDIDDQLEPPIPPGLKQISPHLKQLIEFLEIDADLIEAASTESIEKLNCNLEIKQWLPKLTTTERDKFLLQLLNGEPNVDKQLNKRLRQLADADTNFKKNILENGQRTASQLLAAAEKLDIEKKAKKQRAKEEARIANLNALAPQETQLWVEVFQQINTKTTKGYEQAVKLLSDLKNLAHHLGTTDQFIAKVTKIQQDYSRYSALKTRMIDQKII